MKFKQSSIVQIMWLTLAAIWVPHFNLAFAQENKDDPEIEIRIRAEIWHMPQMAALDILDELQGTNDARPLTRTLRERAKAGEKDLKLVAAPSIVARSGQRAKAASKEQYYISDYRINEKTKKEEPVRSSAVGGTEFEVDPVIGRNEVTIDINSSTEYAISAPILEATTMTGPQSGKELKIYTATENVARVITQTTLMDGQTRLLGTVPTNEGDNSLLMFFIHVDLIEVKR